MAIAQCCIIHLIVLMFLCDTLAASAQQSDNLALYNSQKDPTPLDSTSVVTYYKDHEISEKQARENLKMLKASDFLKPAYCSACSKEHIKYCHSDNMLKDHCCCNQSHNKEQLYFIPHTCYVNDDPCYPSLGSCLTVMEIRNCCCDAQLKKHWRSVLSDAHEMRSSKYLSILLLMLLTAVYY